MLALLPKPKRYLVWDLEMPHLCVEITPRGARTFYFVKKAVRRYERVRIARVVEVSVSMARQRAGILNAAIASGRSPAAEHRAALTAERERIAEHRRRKSFAL